MVIDQQGSAEASANISPFSYQEVRMQVKTMLPAPIEFNDDDNLIELGLDSLKIMRIVNEWRRAGSMVTFAELIEAPRLRDWWSLLQKNNTEFSVVSEVSTEIEADGDENEPFSLTDVQYAYWIGRRDDQPLGGVGCHAYLEIDGKGVEPQRLESAWVQLLTHHSMLRARFLANGQQEVVDTRLGKALLVHDLRLYSESELTLELKRIRNRLSHRRLPVEKGEVAGLELSLLPEGYTRLHFDIDLLVADVQSLQIIIRDLAAAYGRGCSPAAPINWSFSKYLKQEAQRRSLDKKRASQYWNRRLLTLPAAPGLPLREKPEAIRSPVFKRRNYIVKGADWAILQKRSAAHRVTPAMVLLTAYAEVIDRWSTKSQFLINIPLFDRQTGEAGIEDVVADFTSLLLLAVDCSFPQSFLDRARSVQTQFHKDVANAAYSGVQLQRDMARVRKEERMLAPVVFACNLGTRLINAECRETLGKLSYMISQTPQVWLDFQVYETDDGLLLAWDAVDALFPDGLIDQMFTAYTQFIEWLVADGNDWQSSLNVLPAAHQQIRDRDVELSIPQSTQCLHTSFFDFAAANPQQTALIDSHSNTLTYGELARYALQVAALLKEHGVMQGDPVAVTLPRGIEQIAAVFGILALGACYAPISIEQPSIRRDRIHKKAAIRYVLTNHEQAQTTAWPADAVVLDIANTANTTALAEPVEVSPERLAYIIFTSGSTGEPKGVEISHCAAWNTIAEINRRYNVSATDRILAVSSLDFDLSVYDIFGLLSVGGSLVLITEDTRRDAAHWLKLLNRYQVTIWNSVPVLLDMLLVLAESEQQKTLPLRLTMLSGDWIGLDIPTRLHSVTEDCHLVAMGGATEASIWSNFFDVTLPLPAHWTSIPYGRPLANQAYRVVDSKGRDCPDWVAGELWIGGAGVAQGYRGDPRLTAGRFVKWNGSCWYRTGDLGRYLPDRNIEFLGREDFQVKIRGHRIELGEIETTLKQHPGVRDAVVMAVGDPQGERRLVAYVVSDQDKASSLFETQSTGSEEIQTRWASLVEAGRQQAQHSPDDTDLRIFSGFWQGVENLSAACVCSALKDMGVFTQPGEKHSLEGLIHHCGIQPRYRKLVEQWLEILEEEGLLKRDGKDAFVNHRALPTDPSDMVILQEIKQYPNWKEHIQSLLQYLEHISKYHAALLRGDVDPLELLFSDELLLSPEDLIQLLPGTDYRNSIVRELLEVVAKGSSPSKPLRILEVGARARRTTESLLSVLCPDQTIYTYTDVSTFFTNKAKNKFKDYSFVQYQLLDIDQNPQDQGYDAYSYDVIIASNSLHRARNIGITLKYMKSLLAPGGLLFMLEMTRNSRLQKISVGFIEEGFTHFEDERLKENLPLLSVGRWQKVLQSAEFADFVAFPESSYPTEVFGQHVMVAQAPSSLKRFKPIELSNFLEEKLPDYMVPSVYMILDVLPLTPNGKVDRQALPTSEQVRSEPEKTFVAPRTSLEATLADIWGQVLEIERVGIHDNFFELGGDSLLATRLTSRVRNTLEVELSLESLFEAPTIAELAERLQALMQEQVAEPNFIAPLPQIIPAPDQWHLPFPLTDIQQAYWIGRSGVYELGNVATHSYFEIEGADLDIERINMVWQRLIDHHGMMRAVILPDGQQQKILEQVPPYQIKILDLRGEDQKTVESELTKIRDEMSHQVLSTDEWPLFDIRASRFGKERVRLHVSFDNLIFDGWSMFHLLNEWSRLYEDPDASLSSLDLSFRDYILAVEKLQESESYERDQEYWFSRLHSLAPAPELPLAQNPRSLIRQRFNRLDFRLDHDTWQQLKSRAAQVELTPSGILLAAYAEVLSVWSKSPRFTINLTLFNRLPLHPQVNEIIGDFTSLTLLAVDNSLGKTFVERARNLQQQLWQDLDHPYVGGVQVVRELARLHGELRGTIMPVVFTSALGVDSLNKDASGMNWMGNLVYNITQTPQVWLDHQVIEQHGELLLIWDAVQGLFPAGLLDVMFDAYCNLLKSLADEEEAWQETTFKLIPAAQLEKRAEVNATDAPICSEMLHTLFAAQVSQRPKQPAVLSSNRTLSYEKLFHRSNLVGCLLREKGAQPNTLVAVVMEKGWEQVVAVLGILNSGAAYLPVNPDLPRERLWHLLNGGEVNLILTQSWLEERLEWPENLQRFSLDIMDLTGEDARPLDPVQRPEDLAYVIYTSGSTGLPKGVMIDHLGAVNTILDINRRFGVGPEDRVLALSNLNFDLSVYDIFGTLAAGGTIIMPEATGTKDPAHWLQLMTQEQVTIWNSVPALMQMVVEYASGRTGVVPQCLRLALLSGDWIPLDLSDQVKALFEGVQVISLGGATEASIWSSLYSLSGGVAKDWKSIPYGRPMTNQRYYILNESMEDCPNLVPGYLYIGGTGLSIGYFKDKKRTDESFIFHPRTRERLYRTGDLGRWLPDGNMEFLGREDFQVKIDGNRIELGEIEAVIKKCPGVRDAVVTVVEDFMKKRRLAAYVINDKESLKTPDNIFDSAAIRGFLVQFLPDYMVPSVYMRMETFPLTANGKIDRKSLPEPGREILDTHKSMVAPRTPLESEIASIWKDKLEIDEIGIYNNFFELGGDSLLAVTVVNAINRKFRIEFSLPDLFKYPDIAAISNLVRSALDKESCDLSYGHPLPIIVPDAQNRNNEFPLTDVQHAYWIGRSNAFELGNVATHIYAEFERRDTDIKQLNIAFRRLIECHDMLRMIIVPGGKQKILEDVPPYQFEVMDFRNQDREKVEAGLADVRNQMSHQMLPVDRWPLFDIRVSVFEDSFIRLHLSFDALIVDAWSLFIILRDWCNLYDNPDKSLKTTELSFRDYVLAEEKVRKSLLYQRDREYAIGRLSALPPSPALPLVKSPGSIEKPRFKRFSSIFEKSRWEKLKSRATRNGITPSGILLGIYAFVVGHYSKGTRFTLNVTLFNRLPLHKEVNDIVGDFTSLTLLAIDKPGKQAFVTWIQQLQYELWQVIEHRHFSGVRMIRELTGLRRNFRGAAFPVVFTSALGYDSRSGEQSVLSRMGDFVYGITQTPQVILDHQVMEKDGDLLYNWDVVDELFPDGMVEEMFAEYGDLLTMFSADYDIWNLSGSKLQGMVINEKHTDFNATDRPVSSELLHTLFDKQAVKQPLLPAVITPELTIDYGTLRRQAIQLGGILSKNGAKPKSLIAVMMKKGWEQVVAVLGILNSGAAYLPLDPDLPEERIVHILHHGEVDIVLTRSADTYDKKLLPPGVKKIAVDLLEPTGEEINEPVELQKQEDLAYVIYTSGSTGLPKGVMIDHRGAVNTILDINDRFDIGTKDRVFALSELSFDLSVYDIFGTLASGGAIVMPSPEGRKDPAHWTKMIRDAGVTVWNSVPALMVMLTEYLSNGNKVLPEGLRLVLMSGDWIPKDLPSKILNYAKSAEMISLGGATEASIWSIIYPINNIIPWRKSIPYGRPMLNQKFYVLNKYMEKCPDWVQGDLYIGGLGLAKGYFKDSEQTEKSFIIHPDSKELLYRTGDLGCYLPDGNIEFLGREDFQVKVNGYRIELGEIETTLKQHSSVDSAVVKVVDSNGGNARLVGYVVTKKDKTVTPLYLKEYLSKKIPEYMVPNVFVLLNAMPLTPNGKVDRNALPEPGESSLEDKKSYNPPETNMERIIADIFQSVIGLKKIDVRESYFDIGANSLHLVRVQGRLKEQLNREVSIVDLFEYPTVRRLCRYLTNNDIENSGLHRADERAQQRKLVRRRRSSRNKQKST